MQHTKTMMNENYPRWDEKFDFVLISATSKLEVVVMDRTGFMQGMITGNLKRLVGEPSLELQHPILSFQYAICLLCHYNLALSTLVDSLLPSRDTSLVINGCITSQQPSTERLFLATSFACLTHAFCTSRTSHSRACDQRQYIRLRSVTDIRKKLYPDDQSSAHKPSRHLHASAQLRSRNAHSRDPQSPAHHQAHA